MALPALSVPSFEQAKVAFASVKDFLAPVQVPFASDPSALRERLGAALLVIARYTAELERLARSQHKRIAALELALSPLRTAQPPETVIGRALSAEDAATRTYESRTVDCAGTPPASSISRAAGYDARTAASPHELSRSAQSSLDRPHPVAAGAVVLSRRLSAGHHAAGGTAPAPHASAAATALVPSAQQQQQPQRQPCLSLRGKAAWTVVMPAAGAPHLPAAPSPAPTTLPSSLPSPPLAGETARNTTVPLAGGVEGGLSRPAAAALSYQRDAPPPGAALSLSQPLPPLGNLSPALLQSTDQWYSGAGTTQRDGSPRSSSHPPAPSKADDPSQDHDAERETPAELGASVARPATPPLPPPASLLPAQLRTSWSSPASSSSSSAAGLPPPPPGTLLAAGSADAASSGTVLSPRQAQAMSHANHLATVASPVVGRGVGASSSGDASVGGASAGGVGHLARIAQLPAPSRAAPHARLQLARNAVLGGAW